MKSPLPLLVALINDVDRLHSGVKGIDRDLVTINSRVEKEGNSFLTITLPILCDALDKGLADGFFSCPRNFKKVPRGRIPRLFSGIFSEIFDMRTGLLKEDCSVDWILSLRQILRFFKKVTSTQMQEEVLDRKARNDFKETDNSLSDIRFDARREYIVSRVSSKVLLSLGLPDLSSLSFKHGPGAVYERLTANQKWSAVVEGIFSESFDIGTYGLDAFGALERASISSDPRGYYGRYWECSTPSTPKFLSTERLSGVKVDLHEELSWSSDHERRRETAKPFEESRISTMGDDSPEIIDGRSGRISRLVSVEKNSSARRTITVEPVLAQFVQQGLNNMLRDGITKCPILSRCLDLTDQSKNQKLAIDGSRTQEWATLDLSSASDLLSSKLVSLMFDSKPSLLRALMSSRCTHVEDGNEIYPLHKYAGMGNATTFPVQSIVFAILSISAILDCLGKSPKYGNVKRAASCIRVYGDDIIVKTEYVRHVMEWITAFSLRVNVKKSFFTGHFRESCGVDAYRGVDLTPVYVRSNPSDISKKKPNTVASSVALSNNLFLRGYYGAAELLQMEVEKRVGTRLPLTRQSSGVLGWHTRLDASSVTKWNSDLQTLTLRSLAIKSRTIRDPIDGYAGLLKSLLVPLVGRSRGHDEFSSRKFRLRLSREWYCI
jgi:hypothetical protein